MDLTKDLGFQYGFAGTMLGMWLLSVLWLIRRTIPRAETARDAAIRTLVGTLRGMLKRQSRACLTAQREQSKLHAESLAKLERFWGVELKRSTLADDKILQQLAQLRAHLGPDKTDVS